MVRKQILRIFVLLLIGLSAFCRASSAGNNCIDLVGNLAKKFGVKPPAGEKLIDPFEGKRPHGIKALHELAAKYGVVSVLDDAPPEDPKELKNLEMLYGTALRFTSEHKRGTPYLEIPEVVLDVDYPIHTANKIRSKHANLYLGYKNWHKLLEDKWLEFASVSSFAKDSMPQTVRLKELLGEKPYDDVSKLKPQVRSALARMNEAGSSGQAAAASREARKGLTETLTRFLAAANEKFPDGALLKPIDGAASSENNALIFIPINKRKIQKWTDGFFADLSKIRRQLKRQTGRVPALDSKEFRDAFRAFGQLPTSHFLYDLLYAPNLEMVQQKAKFQVGSDGYPLEFRVDFVDGEPARVMDRWGRKVDPEHERLAGQAIRDLFRKGPEGFRYTTGGADVSFTPDGKPFLFELNEGADSSFIDPRAYPVEANEYRSTVIGKDTPMIAMLRKIYHSDVSKQVEFMQNADKFFEDLGLDDEVVPNSVNSLASWFRRQYVDSWRRAKDPVERAQLRRNLGKVLSAFKNDKVARGSHERNWYEGDWLRDEAKSYFNSEGK